MAKKAKMTEKNSKKRLRNRAIMAFLITCVFGFGLAAYGLINTGIIHGAENKQKAEAEQLLDETVDAHRGTIYDANMNVLAQSADSYKVYVNPSKISDETTAAQVAKDLCSILDLEYDEVYAKCTRFQKQYVVIDTKVDYDTEQKLEKLREDNTSYKQYIGFEDDVTRYYPYDDFASTVLGFTGSSDNGLSGLEYYYNDSLTGISGRTISSKNAKQEQIASSYETYYAVKEGTSLKLTIDEAIQYYLDSALSDAVTELDATYGYGIVMDVKTGAILAMSSQPDYDLNNPYEIADETTKEEVEAIENEDERQQATSDALYSQWRNRTIQDTYEPGSVFKCVTAAAGIEEGVVTPDEMFVCTGSYQVQDVTYHCSNNSGHGQEDFTTSLMNSCNPIYIEVAQRLGVETFYKYYEAFGVTEKTGVDLPAEATPTAGVTYYAQENMHMVQMSSASFGQSFQVTPLQMLNAINAIANDGKLMQPYIVDSYLDTDGNVIQKTKPTVKRQVVSKLTADTVTDMMVEVVNGGTASNAYVAGYNVAGKTGTSEKLNSEENYYIGSFAGFAPADDPEISILIVIDEPKGGHYTGGKTAAPVAAEVIENTLKYLNVEPEYTADELKEQPVSTPNKVGVETASAKKSLEDAGFTVEVVGSGSKVKTQTPAAGKLISQDGLIVLYTESDKATEKVEVPNLTGLNVYQAKAACKNAGINIQIAGNTGSGYGSSYKQNISAGTKVTRGSVVTVSYMQTTNKESDIEDTGNAD